ncbi:MAG: potassium-transporting ATPase subunit KdpC [Terriglobia bacterium]|jgi:potassium-transporting ATPase KdpC subunit
MRHQITPAFRLMLVLTVLTGLVYPGIVTGFCQVFFRWQANGSMLSAAGKEVGSALIGQNFAKPEYFHPRPSAAGNDGYDATASTGSNYGPTNQKLIDRVKSSVEQFRKENPDYTGPIPADLLTASASGLDPEISPASAKAQAPRVAKARGVGLEQVEALINQDAKSAELGFLGEPRVNVLELNLKLDEAFPAKGK